MAHYPRGRDWDQRTPDDSSSESGPSPESPPPGGEPPPAAEPSPAAPVAPSPAASSTGWTPPAEPGGIEGWIPPEGTLREADTATGAWQPAETVQAAGTSGSGAIPVLVRRFWFLGIIAIVAIGAFVLRDRITGSAGDLQVGDCFDLPAASLQEVEDVQHHPCTEAHTAEVILVYDIAGDEFPSDDAFLASIEERCVPAFADYTGSTYESQATLDIFWFTPTREGWRNGDREISCALFRVDEEPMTQSMQGTNPT